VTVRVLADLRSPMLLLHSRSVRVTATCSVKSRHPFFRRYGTNLPNSLTPVAPDGPSLSPGEHLCRISVRSPCAVSRALGTSDLRCVVLRSLRAVTASTIFHDSTGRWPRSLFPKALAELHGGTGILTSFPVVVPVELRWDLGPANPRLIGSAEEPLLVRPSGV
jgi:hypothetical protein